MTLDIYQENLTKNKVNKFIDKDKLEEYLSKGWNKGRFYAQRKVPLYNIRNSRDEIIKTVRGIDMRTMHLWGYLRCTSKENPFNPSHAKTFIRIKKYNVEWAIGCYLESIGEGYLDKI